MSVAWRRTLEWAPALAAGLFALAAARAWGAPATGSPLWLAALGLAALAAAFHRPFGGAGLGLGAAVLPLAAAAHGVTVAGLLAGATALTAELLHRSLRRRLATERDERRSLLRLLAGAAAATAAAIAATAAGLARPGWGLAAYLGVLGGLESAARMAREPGVERASPIALAGPLALAATGYGAGLAIAAAADRGGFGLGVTLLLLWGLLAAEAARQALYRAASERRLGDLLAANREARRRQQASAGGAPGIAAEVHAECRKALAPAWFQFDLFPREGEPQSWWARGEEAPEPGEAEPPPSPPALPGFHRRPAWRLLDYPLLADGAQVARLRLWCDPRRLDPAAVELLETLLSQLAGRVQGVLLDREAREDPLTGAVLRRHLERRLALAFARSLDTGSPLTVVMCDLDHFKRINDDHGHAAGDEVLRRAAAVLRAHCRERDLCARYGGEEFTLLLEDTGGETGLEIAERVRRAIAALEVPIEGDEILRVTASAGVATFPDLHARGPGDLVALADAALYEAKRQGRNRCLLDLGGGRLRTVDGSVVEGAAVRPPVEPPRLFA